MEKKILLGTAACVIFGLATLGLIYWFALSNNHDDAQSAVHITPTVAPASLPVQTPTPSPLPTPEITVDSNGPSVTQLTPVATPEPKPTAPTPPPLNDSDTNIKAAISELPEGGNILSLLTNDEIVRKIVRSVYGLSEGRVVHQYRPTSSPKGRFETTKIGKQTPQEQQEIYRISRDNESRYTAYVSLLSAIDKDQLIQMYNFYRPIFEQAYQELGLNKGSFHSTLLTAIDSLLDAPETQKALLLVRPSVHYKFYDKSLEQLPASHKLLLRMGRENSEALKLELKEIRERLARL